MVVCLEVSHIMIQNNTYKYYNAETLFILFILYHIAWSKIRISYIIFCY